MFLDEFRLISANKKILISLLLFFAPASHAASIEKQRIIYENAIEAIEKNDIKGFQKLKKKLKNYPLYPYLEYRDFSLRINDVSHRKVTAFEKKYKALPFSDTVRHKYLHHLAQEREWKTLIKYQKVEPFSTQHQCNYYYAHSKSGNKELALKGAKKLFLSGQSVNSACDKLFYVLEQNNQLTDELIMERMLLVYKAGNKKLLRYLANGLSAKNKETAKEVMAFYSAPEKVLSITKGHSINSYQAQLYQQAFMRLVSLNPEKATVHFDSFVAALELDKREQQQLAEFVIHHIMSTDKPQLAEWRDKWLLTSTKQSLLERRFRTALIANDSPAMLRWIAEMSLEDQQKPKWQYWQARLLFEQGKTQEAKALLTRILGQRDFYSVAAAMHLNENISIPFQSTKPAFEQLKPFREPLERVSELEILNKASESKSEWNSILAKANRQQKAILAAHAYEKGWYAHSVQATISGKLWEHLEYRFPVAHRWFFEQFSRENNLPISTLLALSRQESAFHSEAVSPVGARGLMQLMPTTAKETSFKLGLNYRGADTLSDPGTNIRLGSGYLRLLLDKFEQNRILAFAAYNAGPNRVDKWLKQSQGSLDVISFIESIPYYETRGYVQNVLMYEIYYRKLLGMPMQFLDDKELAYRY